ncbi:MAG TPA: AMP-binding protein [Polyangiaceae bacterium]|nr:AMP-binding protein [Polyangiaceae bacterium]
MSERNGTPNGAHANGAHANGAHSNGAHSNGHAAGNGKKPPLHPDRLFRDRKLVIIGGTGFLGKVFWSMLLARYPQIGRLYLLVRPKKGQTAEQRFWAEIATSEVLRPLRDQYGPGYELFLKDKIVPIAGDVADPYCGIDSELREELRGEIDVVINASGVIDFDPPLDLALQVNAFGVQNLVALAKDLGNVRLMHTSTCFVAGQRQGFIEEVDPRTHPFPRSGELERAHWEPDREISECLDVIEQVRHRANDAFRQSRFLDEAKRNLEGRNEPSSGRVLEDEIARVKRKYVEARLAEAGTERAQFWGWPNTYTYTKSIGEQIVAASGLSFTIVRPAVVESSVEFPVKGWNEGINTSAPLLYSVINGQTQIPGSDHCLDVIPCDMVAAGMALSLAELLEGSAPAVYQYGTSDTNPCAMSRFLELCGLYKRKKWQRTGKGGPVVSFLQSHVESALLSEEAFDKYGPELVSKGATTLSKFLDAVSVNATKPLFGPASKALSKFADQQLKVKKVLDNFVPFVARYDYTFRCDNTLAAYERLGPEDKQKLPWTPESIDWRHWFLDIHMPGLEKWVFPEIDKRLERKVRAPVRHETLATLLTEMATRFDLAVALQRTEAEGLSRITFREWRSRSLACAARLAELGVKPGDRVVLAAANHPAWAIAFFGIQYAGATAVPVDAAIEAGPAGNIVRASRAKVLLCDGPVDERLRPSLRDAIRFASLQDVALPGPEAVSSDPKPSDVAALIYTSGTTGTPKGVMLSHENITSLVASLAPLFPLGKSDRVLSVLPLHHTFELTCGLLLPLSRGARVIYLDELTSDRLSHGLEAGRITAMVGVPALWEMLERKLLARVAERGAVASRVFDVAAELNRTLGRTMGLDAGKVLFGPVHEGLGGHLKYLVSGGAALPEETHSLFAGLGLHLTEGYGLTEAAPVLAVASARPGAKPGHVGKAVPGVELRIHEPNAEGVGEILARGPNVMLGYADDEEETRRTIDEDGWLHTGDLGKLDRKGNLAIVGRAKDTIVASNGENVYPDDVEARLGSIDRIQEYVVLGVVDPRGGERIACVAVPTADDSVPKQERHAAAKQSLDKALATLPAGMRPAVTLLIDVPLPRTATRKVKRPEVRRLVERVTAPAIGDAPPVDGAKKDGAARLVRAAVAVIARKNAQEISSAMTLRGDLGMDSLMLLELLVALEGQVSDAIDADRLNTCETVQDVESLLAATSAARRMARKATVFEDEETSLELPPGLRNAAMHWLGRSQMGFYERVMRTRVSGRAFIPENRSVLVAANHASHLDMGLVKYALGPYGQGMVSLAAQDYFFESGKWRKAYFENLTNLAPIARNGSLRQSLRQAGDIIDQGKVVLIFPEGTRSPDGAIHEFKPAIGYLAREHRVDVLPVWLGGTHGALPKGANMIRKRDLTVRIGPPIEHAEVLRLTEGMGASEASRAIAKLTRRAVVALSRGKVLDTRTLSREDLLDADEEQSMEELFKELEHRFVAGSVTDPVSFYFALGKKERWTVNVSKDGCQVVAGKGSGQADCVLKTSPAMFTRIVKEAYTPTPGEFMSGTVKSNNIALLMTFQRVFQLAPGES